MQKIDLATLKGAELVAFWNGLPGVTPVKKFTTAAIGRARIEKQLATSPDPVPEPETGEEPVLVKARKAKSKKSEPLALTPTKEKILPLLQQGASLVALARKLGWNKVSGPNSVRGLLSTMRTKDKLPIITFVPEGSDRLYKIAS